MKKIIIIRHGQTALNSQQQIQGRRDFPLTETGLLQVKKLSDELLQKKLIPEIVFSSPLIRARNTAELLVAKLGGNVIISNHLTELDYGNYEGQPTTILKSIQYGYHTQKMSQAQGETVDEVAHRLLLLLIEISATHYHTIFLVTHAFSASVLRQLLEQKPLTFKEITTLPLAHYYQIYLKGKYV